MGLDMYLTARKSSYKPFGGEPKDNDRKIMTDACDALGLPNIDNIDYITIEREVGYWRKANAIHAYFVKHHQDGVDECRPSDEMDKNDLQKLRYLCAELLVKKDPAEVTKKMPPQAGFFFGGTDIDQWFWEDLENTIKICDQAIAIPGEVTFIYRSSW